MAVWRGEWCVHLEYTLSTHIHIYGTFRDNFNDVRSVVGRSFFGRSSVVSQSFFSRKSVVPRSVKKPQT